MSDELMTKEQTERETREAALRSALVELTGAPDADANLARMYSGYGDAEKRDRALVLYIEKEMPIERIAEEVGVPERTVAAWAYVGKWHQPVAMEMAVRQREEAMQLARLRVRQRREVIQKQLDSAQMVRDKVEAELDNMSAKSAAEALKAAADIENRALGMSENGRTDFMEREEEKKRMQQEGKVPLVFVIKNDTGSGIPVLRKGGEVVDV